MSRNGRWDNTFPDYCDASPSSDSTELHSHVVTTGISLKYNSITLTHEILVGIYFLGPRGLVSASGGALGYSMGDQMLMGPKNLSIAFHTSEVRQHGLCL